MLSTNIFSGIFKGGGDEARAAQDEFRVHFQTNTSNTRDIQNANEGTTLLFTRKRRRAITDVERKALFKIIKESEYMFAKLSGAENYKEWAREMI